MSLTQETINSYGEAKLFEMINFEEAAKINAIFSTYDFPVLALLVSSTFRQISFNQATVNLKKELPFISRKKSERIICKTFPDTERKQRENAIFSVRWNIFCSSLKLSMYKKFEELSGVDYIDLETEYDSVICKNNLKNLPSIYNTLVLINQLKCNLNKSKPIILKPDFEDKYFDLSKEILKIK
jgi:hypothetical protein